MNQPFATVFRRVESAFDIIYFLYLQLTIQARDKGTPPLNSQQNARVTVTVARNRNAPRFEGTPYSVTVDRDAEVDTEVDEVTARDSDTTVRMKCRKQ